MAVLSAFVTVVLPVFLVAGVGALLGRSLTLDLTTLTKISLNGLTPALVLKTLLTTEVHPVAGLRLVAAYFTVVLLGAALGWVVAAGEGAPARRAVSASTAIGNNGNMGLPIAAFALGAVGLDQSVLIFLSSVVAAFLLLPLLFGSTAGPRGALRAVARLPAMWAMAVAVVVRVLHLPVPVGVSRAVDLLGSATLPMILLTLGIQLGTSGRVRLTRAVVMAVVLRVLVLPVVSLGVGVALGLRGLPLQALVLATAMPTAVNAYLLAREYSGDHETVANAVTVSTLASVATAAVVTALLPWVGSI